MKTDVDGEVSTTVGKNHTLRIAEKHLITSKATDETVEDDKAVSVVGDLKVKAAGIKMYSTENDVWIKSAGLATLHGTTDAKVNKA